MKAKVTDDESTVAWSSIVYVTVGGGSKRGYETIAEARSETLPTTFSLSQNYPNPFNPSTTIRFGLPERSEVSITVYDVMGREIGQLARESMNAGYHDIQWDAGELPGGVYVYKIVAGDFVDSKSMVLLK